MFKAIAHSTSLALTTGGEKLFDTELVPYNICVMDAHFKISVTTEGDTKDIVFVRSSVDFPTLANKREFFQSVERIVSVYITESVHANSNLGKNQIYTIDAKVELCQIEKIDPYQDSPLVIVTYNQECAI